MRRWVAPLPQPLQVVRAFDPPALRWDAGHRGVDLKGGVGATVRAAGAGRISYAGLLAGRGVVVVVHGDLRTTYEPVAAAVKVGQTVAPGDPIGALDSGHDPWRPSSGVLHWGLVRGQTYLDPLTLLSGVRPVRLLPWWGLTPAGPPPTVAARTAPPAPPQPAVDLGSRLPIGVSLAVGAAAAVVAAAVSRRPP